jgi:hypothetical protein
VLAHQTLSFHPEAASFGAEARLTQAGIAAQTVELKTFNLFVVQSS